MLRVKPVPAIATATRIVVRVSYAFSEPNLKPLKFRVVKSEVRRIFPVPIIAMIPILHCLPWFGWEKEVVRVLARNLAIDVRESVRRIPIASPI